MLKVILLQDIRDFGGKGEVKNASDGYARNFLVPRGLAKIATPQAVAELEKEKAGKEKKAAAEISRNKESAAKLGKIEIKFSAKSSDGRAIFGSIGAQKIVEALKEKGFEIDKSRIDLKSPLKTIGEHLVGISFGAGIEAKVKVLVEEEK